MAQQLFWCTLLASASFKLCRHFQHCEHVLSLISGSLFSSRAATFTQLLGIEKLVLAELSVRDTAGGHWSLKRSLFVRLP